MVLLYEELGEGQAAPPCSANEGPQPTHVVHCVGLAGRLETMCPQDSGDELASQLAQGVSRQPPLSKQAVESPAGGPLAKDEDHVAESHPHSMLSLAHLGSRHGGTCL